MSQNHQKLTIVGFVLLVITFFISHYNEEHPEIEFNYAYISGIAMIIAFMASFGLFYKERFKPKNE